MIVSAFEKNQRRKTKRKAKAKKMRRMMITTMAIRSEAALAYFSG